jgi:hypothetical protein
MTAKELPDYLALFLEFLSLLPRTEAQSPLAEPATILRALASRLSKRDAGDAAVLAVLANLAQAPVVGTSAIPDEDPNDLAALDAAWEEAAVCFGPGEAMDGMQHRSAAHASARGLTRRCGGLKEKHLAERRCIRLAFQLARAFLGPVRVRAKGRAA